MMSTTTNEQLSTEEYSSSRHSTPNSSGGDKPFHFGSNTNIERGSGQNSRTSSVAESSEGFSNYLEIIQHLQTVWNNHQNITEGSRRSNNDETVPSHYSKGHSHHHNQQQHYPHHNPQYSGHQNWSNYNNSRRSGGNGNYSRGYNPGNNDGYWNPKGNRFPSHRSVNSLMTNSTNYQQPSQPSPPTQRRQGDINQPQQQFHHNDQQQTSQAYYKKTRSDHDRRSNGSNSHQSSGYSSHNSIPNLSSEQSTLISKPFKCL